MKSKRLVGTGLLVLSAAVAAQSTARAAESCGDLLIVLDRSGSMAGCKVGGKLKETLAKNAIKSVTDTFASVPMGLAVFPDTLNSCAHSNACNMAKIVVPVQSGGATMVTSWLSKMPTSCGGTPTGDSMVVVQNYTWPDSEAKYTHYVLLITDGQPTCQDGEDGATPDPSTGDCKPSAMCDGQGTCECKKPTKVYGAIKALFDKGVHTFIVGFEGVGMPIDPGGMACGPDPSKPFNPDTLNMMADMGGEAQAAPAPTKYYSAVDENSLNMALQMILGKISVGTVGGCTHGGGGGTGGSGGGTGGGSGTGGSAGTGGAGTGGSGGGQGGGNGDDAGGTGGSGAHGATSGTSCLCALPGREGGSPAGLVMLAPLGWLGIALSRARRRGRRL